MKTKLAVLIGLVAIIAYGAFSAVDSDGLPAWWLYRGVATVSASLKSLQDALTPPPLRIFDTVYGPMKAQMLHVAVHFQIADHLHKEPLDIRSLAAKAGVKEGTDGLNRFMNALIAFGYFARDSKNRFINNAASEYLRVDHPTSTVPLIKHMCDESYNTYEMAIESIKTGKNAFVLKNGAPVFDWYRTHPEHKENFAKTMSSFGSIVNKALVADYDFSRYRTIVDVGGSEGSLVRAILKQYPTIEKAYIFDLPEVIEEAKKALETEDPTIRNKIELVSGDFFKEIPIKADAYLMRFILHDWADQDCLKILENIFKKSIPGNTTVLVVEQLLGETPATHIADLQMYLVTSGGRERTYKHFKNLLKAGGFKIYDVAATRSPFNVIEARATKSLVQYTGEEDMVLNTDLER
jgi:C-methyltransferase